MFWTTNLVMPLSAHGEGLQTCTADDFVIMVADRHFWRIFATSWSHEAEPGCWVMRAGKVPLDGQRPDGILVGALRDDQLEDPDDERRFLVLWSR